MAPKTSGSTTPGTQPLVIDGIEYRCLYLGSIPPAYAEVDIKLDDNGHKHDVTMVAGVVGTRVQRVNVLGNEGEQLSPVAGWWIFTRKADPAKLGKTPDQNRTGPPTWKSSRLWD
jgi:hypothetical protein